MSSKYLHHVLSLTAQSVLGVSVKHVIPASMFLLGHVDLAY